jgi:hypothetical protein
MLLELMLPEVLELMLLVTPVELKPEVDPELPVEKLEAEPPVEPELPVAEAVTGEESS